MAKWTRGTYRRHGSATSWLKVKHAQYSQFHGRRKLFEARRDRCQRRQSPRTPELSSRLTIVASGERARTCSATTSPDASARPWHPCTHPAGLKPEHPSTAPGRLGPIAERGAVTQLPAQASPSQPGIFGDIAADAFVATSVIGSSRAHYYVYGAPVSGCGKAVILDYHAPPRSTARRMKPRPSTIAAVLAVTIAAAIASAYITPPWDMYATLFAAAGTTAFVLLTAVRFQTSH